MSPVGADTLIPIKPIRHQSWLYYVMNICYFAPDLKHYRIIKAVTETGAARLSDKFKFKHHELQAPQLSLTGLIVKSTQALAQKVEGKMMHHQMNSQL